MDVVAEGIESKRHLEFLRRHNCHFGQGRLFGEPCTAQELGEMLKAQEAGRPPFAEFFPARDEAGTPARRA